MDEHARERKRERKGGEGERMRDKTIVQFPLSSFFVTPPPASEVLLHAD
jgi:hypothetical protein